MDFAQHSAERGTASCDRGRNVRGSAEASGRGRASRGDCVLSPGGALNPLRGFLRSAFVLALSAIAEILARSASRCPIRKNTISCNSIGCAQASLSPLDGIREATLYLSTAPWHLPDIHTSANPSFPPSPNYLILFGFGGQAGGSCNSSG